MVSVPPQLAGNVLVVSGGLLGLLSLATVIVWVRAWAKPKADHRELKLRMQTWWLIAVMLLGSLAIGRTASIVFFGFMSFLAFKEYLSIIPTRRADRRVLFWAYLALVIQYVIVGLDRYELFLIFVPVCAFLIIPLRMLSIGETKDFLKAVSTIQWGLMTTTFCLSHLAFLLVLPGQREPAQTGAGLVLFVLVLTGLNDVAQFIWGKSLGKRKILPKISPNKTVAGLVGGVLTTAALGGLLGPRLTPLALAPSLFVGFAIGLAGFFGDVSISAIKRDLGIKDTGTTLPGHGGILDRVDSLTYTAPVVFYLLKYLHYSNVT